MVPEGVPGQKKIPFKCHTFPKSSRRAGSEYVKVEIFRWGPSEILPVHARCMRACTLRKFSRFFFSTGIVCPDIEMT